MEGKAGRNFWWVAPIFAQAKIAYPPTEASPTAGLYTANETEMTITFANGAVIWFKSAEHPTACTARMSTPRSSMRPAGAGRRRGTPFARP